MKRLVYGYAQLIILIVSFAACSSNDTNTPDDSGAVSGDFTTVSGTITISTASNQKPSDRVGKVLSVLNLSAGAALAEATVEMYNADRPEWLYPVSVTQTDGSGNYTLSKLTHASENGNSYHDQNPIPSGNYTVIAYKFDANIGKFYVAVQTVVKNFHGAVAGNDLVALDRNIMPSVTNISSLPLNIDGSYGSPLTVLPQNAAIQVGFNTPMARLSLLAAISIKDADANVVQGMWKVSPDLMYATFYPDSKLSDGPVYNITVIGGNDPCAARNLYGNPIAATITGTFVTAIIDVTPPGIALFSPQEQAGVPVTTNPQIASDEVLDINTLLVSVIPGIGDNPLIQYAGKIGIASKPYIYTIVPDGLLQHGTTYEFTINGIKDLAGNISSPFTFSFTTEAVQTPPNVITVTPSANSTGVDVNATISASFSEDMDAATLASPATTFMVSGITGTVIYDAASKTATFIPSVPLALNNVYTATITVGAKDIEGTPLANDYVWSFTTMTGSQRPGDMDSENFGTMGKIALPVGSISSFLFAVAIQQDGKIVAGGYSYSGSTPQFTLARFMGDGSLDVTFGNGGIVQTILNSFSGIAALAIQPDGKIVASGNASGGFGVARYNTDGSLDTAFGTNGQLVTAVGMYAGCKALGLQSDGKIIVAGTAWNGSNHDVVVVRYTANGSLDTSFNGSGKVMTAIGTAHDQAYALAVQGDDKIVIGGYADTAEGRNFAMLRYNGDGSLDTAFGTGGKVTTSLGSSQVNALGIQADGKIVAGGYQANGNFWQVAVVRYNADGSLDNTFDGDGIVLTTVGNWRSEAKALSILPNGKIIVAGYNGTTTLPTDFLLIRYNTDGSLDVSFGSGGVVTTDIEGGDDSANAVAIQSDGKIVTAGQAFVGQRTDFALVRYVQ